MQNITSGEWEYVKRNVGEWQNWPLMHYAVKGSISLGGQFVGSHVPKMYTQQKLNRKLFARYRPLFLQIFFHCIYYILFWYRNILKCYI